MAFLSEAQICNLALLRVGQRQLINSLGEASTEAQVCEAVYAHTRDVLLESAWWQFATRRAKLTLATEKRSGWAYVYHLPWDCVSPRYLWPGARFPAKDGRIPFDVESSAALLSRVLCTDEADAELVYTASVITPALFSAKFQQALSWALAVELTLSLPVKPQLAANAAAMARATLLDAIATERAQAELDVEPEAAHIRARG